MTTQYRIELSRRSAKAFHRLERQDQLRVIAAIELLASDPRPPTCVALSGEENVYRVRVGDLRILYEVVDDRPVILVVRIGHRRDDYR